MGMLTGYLDAVRVTTFCNINCLGGQADSVGTSCNPAPPSYVRPEIALSRPFADFMHR